MAVPAHDTRDFEFAKQFDLPIITVVDPGESGLRQWQLESEGSESAVRNAPSAFRQSPIPNP